MYDMLQTKVDRLAGKTYFVNKKTPKIMDNFLERPTLEGAGGQTDDTRSTFRPPLKTLGYNGSNQLLGRSVASKLWVHEPDTFFWGTDNEINEKRNQNRWTMDDPNSTILEEEPAAIAVVLPACTMYI